MKASNGQIVATGGQGYSAKADCKHAIESIMNKRRHRDDRRRHGQGLTRPPRFNGDAPLGTMGFLTSTLCLEGPACSWQAQSPVGCPVLIFDFGSQYGQLIARRVREQNVFCQIVRHDLSAERVTAS